MNKGFNTCTTIYPSTCCTIKKGYHLSNSESRLRSQGNRTRPGFGFCGLVLQRKIWSMCSPDPFSVPPVPACPWGCGSAPRTSARVVRWIRKPWPSMFPYVWSSQVLFCFSGQTGITKWHWNFSPSVPTGFVSPLTTLVHTASEIFYLKKISCEIST